MLPVLAMLRLLYFPTSKIVTLIAKEVIILEGITSYDKAIEIVERIYNETKAGEFCSFIPKQCENFWSIVSRNHSEVKAFVEETGSNYALKIE